MLEPDHPERRFVAGLCLYSHAVDTGAADCASYDQEEGERFARALLMPAEEFAPLSAWRDAELAECFAAPPDQVAIRRREAGGRERRCTLTGLSRRCAPSPVLTAHPYPATRSSSMARTRRDQAQRRSPGRVGLAAKESS